MSTIKLITNPLAYFESKMTKEPGTISAIGKVINNPQIFLQNATAKLTLDVHHLLFGKNALSPIQLAASNLHTKLVALLSSTTYSPKALFRHDLQEIKDLIRTFSQKLETSDQAKAEAEINIEEGPIPNPSKELGISDQAEADVKEDLIPSPSQKLETSDQAKAEAEINIEEGPISNPYKKLGISDQAEAKDKAEADIENDDMNDYQDFPEEYMDNGKNELESGSTSSLSSEIAANLIKQFPKAAPIPSVLPREISNLKELIEEILNRSAEPTFILSADELSTFYRADESLSPFLPQIEGWIPKLIDRIDGTNGYIDEALTQITRLKKLITQKGSAEQIETAAKTTLVALTALMGSQKEIFEATYSSQDMDLQQQLQASASHLVLLLRAGSHANCLREPIETLECLLNIAQTQQQGPLGRLCKQSKEWGERLDAVGRVIENTNSMLKKLQGNASNTSSNALSLEKGEASLNSVENSSPNVKSWAKTLLSMTLGSLKECLFYFKNDASVVLKDAAIDRLCALLEIGRANINSASTIPETEKIMCLEILENLPSELMQAKEDQTGWIGIFQKITHELDKLPNISVMGFTLPTIHSSLEGDSNIQILNDLVIDRGSKVDNKIDEIYSPEDRNRYYLSHVQESVSMWAQHMVLDMLLGWLGDSSFQGENSFQTIISRTIPFPDISIEKRAEEIKKVRESFRFELVKSIQTREDINGAARFIIERIALPIVSWMTNLSVKHFATTGNDLVNHLRELYDPKNKNKALIDPLQPMTNAIIYCLTCTGVYLSPDLLIDRNLELFIEAALVDPETLRQKKGQKIFARPEEVITKEAAELAIDRYFPSIDMASEVSSMISALFNWANQDALNVNDPGASKELNNAIKVIKWLIASPAIVLLWVGYIAVKLVDWCLSAIFRTVIKQAVRKQDGFNMITEIVKKHLYDAIHAGFLEIVNKAIATLSNPDLESSKAEDPLLLEPMKNSLKTLVNHLMKLLNTYDSETPRQDLLIKLASQSPDNIIDAKISKAINESLVSNIHKVKQNLLRKENSLELYNKILETIPSSLIKEHKNHEIDAGDEDVIRAHRELQIQLKLKFLLKVVVEKVFENGIANIGKNQQIEADNHVKKIEESLSIVLAKVDLLLNNDSIEKIEAAADAMSKSASDWLGREQALLNGIEDEKCRKRLERHTQRPLLLLRDLSISLGKWKNAQREIDSHNKILEIVTAIAFYQKRLRDLTDPREFAENLNRIETEATSLIKIIKDFDPIKSPLPASQLFVKELKGNADQLAEKIAELKENQQRLDIYRQFLKIREGGKNLIEELKDAASQNSLFSSAYKEKLREIDKIIAPLPQIPRDALKERWKKKENIPSLAPHIETCCNSIIENIEQKLTSLRFEKELEEEEGFKNQLNQQIAKKADELKASQRSLSCHYYQLKHCLEGINPTSIATKKVLIALNRIDADLARADANAALSAHNSSALLKEYVAFIQEKSKRQSAIASSDSFAESLSILQPFIHYLENAEAQRANALYELNYYIAEQKPIKKLKDSVALIEFSFIGGLNQMRRDLRQIIDQPETAQSTQLFESFYRDNQCTEAKQELTEILQSLLDFEGFLTPEEGAFKNQIEKLLRGIGSLEREEYTPESLSRLIKGIDDVIAMYMDHRAFWLLPWVNLELIKKTTFMVPFLQQKVINNAVKIAHSLRKLISTPSFFKMIYLKYLEHLIEAHKK